MSRLPADDSDDSHEKSDLFFKVWQNLKMSSDANFWWRFNGSSQFVVSSWVKKLFKMLNVPVNNISAMLGHFAS